MGKLRRCLILQMRENSVTLGLVNETKVLCSLEKEVRSGSLSAGDGLADWNR